MPPYAGKAVVWRLIQEAKTLRVGPVATEGVVDPLSLFVYLN